MSFWVQKTVLHSHLISHITNSFHMHLIFPLQKYTGRIPWSPEAGILFSVIRQDICPYLLLRFQALSNWTGWNCACSQPQPFFAAQSNLTLNTMPNLHCCNQDQHSSANLNNHYASTKLFVQQKKISLTEELLKIWSSAVADRETKIPCNSKME